MTYYASNGWTASPTTPRRKFYVQGAKGPVEYVGGIRDNNDVVIVMQYVMDQVAKRVEKPINPGCWGGNFRENKNNPGVWSNHAAWIALDHNAPKHPNGVATSRVFSSAQIAEIHQILSEVSFVVRWGGDYRGTPDAMHFEINVNADALHAVAERLRKDAVKPKPTPLPRKVRIWLGAPKNVKQLQRQIRRAEQRNLKAAA